MNEKGAILPTVMVLISLSCIMVFGSSILFKNQRYEQQMLADSYRIKTMLNIVENDLRKEETAKKDYHYVFNQGQVQVKYIPPTQYELNGSLDNGFANKRYLFLEPSDSNELEIPMLDHNKN